MTEWILILTLNIVGQPGEIRDISPEVVSGFQSKQACDAAATKISHRLIYLSGKAREQQQIQMHTNRSAPAVWYECLQITK